MKEKSVEGFLSRLLSRGSTTSSAERQGSEDRAGFWGDNRNQSVRPLVERALKSQPCLIVTGYQDFLSAMSLITETIPDLGKLERGAIRIVFGTNTDNSKTLSGKGKPVSEEARQYYLGSQGLSVNDLSEVRAVLALGAIERGAISLRIFDRDRAKHIIGRSPALLHAKLFAGEDVVLSGSSNFSKGGLRHNLEFMDDVAGYPELAGPRRDSAKAFWEMGVDWSNSAIKILQDLIRLVSPEQAIARTIKEMKSFQSWKVDGLASAGRPPQPFQAELVYEAAGTIYEHGFAFVEAPTGAGKTDIGKHLATVLPVTHSRAVLPNGERADENRLGALALIPASVLGNWDKNRPAHFDPIKHSYLSKHSKDEQEELDEVNQKVRSAAAMIVDESHRLASRYLAPSKRSLVFEQSPAIWTACLSATLMGNQGLDGLLAFHEKRSSIYVPPTITARINANMGKVRERENLLKDLQELSGRIEERTSQGDFFETPESLERKKREREKEIQSKGLESREIQADLAEALAPYVVRRQRDCIGESADRNKEGFSYPPFLSHRKDAELTEEQQRVFQRIKVLAEAITTGVTLVSAEPKRAARSEIKFHDKSRIHIRNFLAVLRTSVGFAREEWKRQRSTFSDQRGRASIGESLRRAEKQNSVLLPIPNGELDRELRLVDPTSPTPVCDRIKCLLEDPVLDDIDDQRAKDMQSILDRHGQVIYLAERVGVLELYAQMLKSSGDRNTDVILMAQGNKLPRGSGIVIPKSSSEGQDYLGLGGAKVNRSRKRALFMTYQMAEGINLQEASALCVLGVTSDIKSLIQGLGRIDRIDSPHSEIHYYTFDLPGLVLSSDLKGRNRIESLALLSGVGAEELPGELAEFSAGDLTELILQQNQRSRPLRDNNVFDLLEKVKRRIDPKVVREVEAIHPEQLWGAEVCLLASTEPVTILALGGQTPTLRQNAFFPPRLVAVKDSGQTVEVLGDQAEVGRLLQSAFEGTKRLGKLGDRPSIGEVDRIVADLSGSLSQLTHWDIRPARTVSLLSSLAEFLQGVDINDEGHGLLGFLSLSAMEKLCEAWAEELDPSWIEAKRAVSAQSSKGVEIPDYLGIEAIVREFRQRPYEIIEAARIRMQKLYDNCVILSENEDTGVLNRISVVMHATGHRKLV